MSVDWNSRNQGLTKPRRVNFLIAIAIVAIALVAGAVYAVTQLTVTNNVTITSIPAIGVETFTANPTSCPALGSSSYSTTSPASNTVAWVISAGGSQTQFFCIENQGSGNDPTPSIILGSVPSTITCSAAPCLTLTTTPATIPALNAQSITLPIAVTISATASTTGSGTVDVTVS